VSGNMRRHRILEQVASCAAPGVHGAAVLLCFIMQLVLQEGSMVDSRDGSQPIRPTFWVVVE
jgi:hypothetical protein